MKRVFHLIVIGALTGFSTCENVKENTYFLAHECYENEYLLERDNRLPHTVNTFLAILRKIENSEGLMDLQRLSVSLLHRFRQDGIGQNPNVRKQDGITPYAPIGFQYFRHLKTLRSIPGNAIAFPNNSITAVERCTLHFMLSSSIEIYEREDEGTVCRFADRGYRRIRRTLTTQRNIIEDVETLSPKQIEIMTNNKENSGENTIDPNLLYPELPPNHPDIARISEPPLSKCPVENGIIKTEWGTVSLGPVLAGIAAALETQNVTLSEFLQDGTQDTANTLTSTLHLDSKWLSTLAGDLAEVALRQGPQGKSFVIGATGNWNSTSMPRWYFLNSNENLEFTAAEVRGDLDGLILANTIKEWYTLFPRLRLSQIIDMYYSARGLFNSTIRACNRRVLFTSVSPNSTMSAQAFSAAWILNKYLAKATLSPHVIERFAVDATRELTKYIPSQLNDDLSCKDTDKFYDVNRIAVDLTIILDTNWPFAGIQSILANLLNNMDINQYDSNFTIINGYDGNAMINSSNNILDFYSYNSSHYNNVTHGFDLPKSIKMLKWMQLNKLNNERDKRIGGARSDVVLIIPYTSSISDSDKEYCTKELTKMRIEVPDMTILILTYGSKDRWSNLVYDSTSDLFSISIGSTNEPLTAMDGLISRVKQVPKRLLNTQCGADYVSHGTSDSYTDYLAPDETKFYKLHPNYFFTTDTSSEPTIKIQGSGQGSLTVCTSRDLLHHNATEARSLASCVSITNNVHSITISCADASLIQECPPVYVSIAANATNILYQSTDEHIGRFPYEVKYTFSYENLVCTSNASMIVLNPLIIILVFIYSLL